MASVVEIIHELSHAIRDLSKRVRRLETQTIGNNSLSDYSDLSTVIGWGSYTVIDIWYKRNGGLVFVFFIIEGISDSTSTSFTLPFYANSNIGAHGSARVMDNSGTPVMSYCRITAGTNKVDIYPAPIGGNWTASGQKTVRGELVVPI